MKVIILCGGKGTRAYPFTEYMPKPMVPVDGSPILVQVMRIFAAQGYKKFVLAVGHRKAVIADYFEGQRYDWEVQIVDTGEETDTGGRVFRCRDYVGEQFFATYADGLANVEIAKLLTFHNSHQGHATITSVPLISQYGTLSTDEHQKVVQFTEKPVLPDHWINAGYFAFNKKVFEHWQGENLEREVFPSLARKGLVYSYRHTGFFKSMDSYKDQQEFEAFVSQGKRPWKPSKEAHS